MSSMHSSEVKANMERIKGDRYLIFCYPNGNYSDKIVSMVQDAGYHLAVTTQKGWNIQRSNPFTLRRIGIHQDMSSTIPLFACRIAGLI